MKVIHKRSNGNSLPAASAITYGEIAVNYKSGSEALIIKNDSDEIVTFGTDKNNPFEPGSGENSAVLKGSNGAAFGANSVVEGVSVTVATNRGITTASTDADIIAEWTASTPDTDKFSLAKGEASHVEGNNNLALGNHSHAEGNGTVASNNSAHAEGTGSQATNKYAHAEGLETVASGKQSHSEGSKTSASASSSHAEGESTIANQAATHAEGINTIAGTGARPTAETDTTAGKYSHAEGNGTQASGNSSHAEGRYTLASGESSHAEGRENIASGNRTHVEGMGNQAKGNQAHAEGNNTIANAWASHTEGYNTETGGNYSSNTKTPDTDDNNGDTSHAEGNATIAQGPSSHSEGIMTFAAGKASHAEGYTTTASGQFAHSEGEDTIASGQSSHAEGNGSTATGDHSHAEGYGADANGNYSHAEGEDTNAESDNSHAEGANTTAGLKGYYYKFLDINNRAFYLSETNVPLVSSAEQAYDSSFICPYEVGDTYGFVDFNLYCECGTITAIDGNKITVSSLPISTVTISSDNEYYFFIQDKPSIGVADFGYCSHAEGSEAQALNFSAHAEGYKSKALGWFSHAEGRETTSHYSAHAEGRETIALGNASHAEGKSTQARGEVSHAEGNESIASGYGSHAEGNKTQATENWTHAEGEQTQATGPKSHAEGTKTKAAGHSSHVEGYNCVAGNLAFVGPSSDVTIGYFAHAEGNGTLAQGNSSHAEGRGTKANGYSSHAEGADTIASGGRAHAEGDHTTASGVQSHAEGASTTASGNSSHAEGGNTTARNMCEHAEGRYNVSNSATTTYGSSGNTQHSVGIGTSNNNRKNAIEIMQNGDAYLYGVGGYSGTTIGAGISTLQNVVNDKASAKKTIIDFESSSASTYPYSNQYEGLVYVGMGNASSSACTITLDMSDTGLTEGMYFDVVSTTDQVEGNVSFDNISVSVGSGTPVYPYGNRITVANGVITVPGGTSARFMIVDWDTDMGVAVFQTSTEVETCANMKEVTWSTLKTLRDGGNLTPGMQYRITDYNTTTTQADTQSAGHQFDIIVVADDNHTLNENARAVRHAGDTYFSGATLEAWELKYDIDNDVTKYAWADSGSTGRGVIYYMKDEWNNECPYDFKNIQFKRYKIDTCTKSPDLEGLYSIADAYEITADTSTTYWCYTFSMINLFEDCIDDVTVYQTKYPSDEGFAYLTHDNVFKEYIDTDYDEGVQLMMLPNNVMVTDTDICSIEDDYSYGEFYGFYSNTFGNNFQSNTFGKDCYSNTFGNDCGNNTFGNNCYSNTFGNDCYSNTFGNDCYSNTFGNDCGNNTFGNNCYSNTFGNNCARNTFGNNFQSNTFGNNFQSNTFGNNCARNTFGNNFQSNTFGNNCWYNTFGNNCQYINVQKAYVYYIIVENGNKYINITSTQTTSSSNILRNFTISQGVNNTTTRKTISHNTVNDTFKTTYQPANSQIISV